MISTTDRDTRVAEIQAAALVRQALGQAAAYRRAAGRPTSSSDLRSDRDRSDPDSGHRRRALQGGQAVGTTTLTIKDLALGYVAGGLALVPCSPKDKRPDMALLPRDPQTHKPTWKSLADHPADAATVQSWLDRGCKTMAAATGKPSGGLLIIDFDEARFLEPWKVAVAELADGLPVQRTGRGFQVALRCPDPGENAELAWVADEKEETGRRIAIETRGEGGYAILPGSLHPSGKLYAAIAGDWANIATVSQARADSLLAAAKKTGRGSIHETGDGEKRSQTPRYPTSTRREPTVKDQLSTCSIKRSRLNRRSRQPATHRWAKGGPDRGQTILV
jgi:hypothetical protein